MRKAEVDSQQSIVVGIWEAGWNLRKSRNQDRILGYKVEVDGRAIEISEKI